MGREPALEARGVDLADEDEPSGDYRPNIAVLAKERPERSFQLAARDVGDQPARDGDEGRAVRACEGGSSSPLGRRRRVDAAMGQVRSDALAALAAARRGSQRRVEYPPRSRPSQTTGRYSIAQSSTETFFAHRMSGVAS